jgi:uncharacterized phage-like protein YoqJ
MAFNFERLNDPEFKKEWEAKQKARDDREQQIIDWREITVGATGHRSDKMGGWKDSLGGYDNKHPLVVQLRTALLEVLEELIVNQGKTRFISGGALGFDTMFFWAVNHLKQKYPHIENVLAVPFMKQYIRWKPQQRYWYHEMVKKADTFFDVARQEDYNTREHEKGKNPIPLDDFSHEKMDKRNHFMVDQSGVMVAFFDGSKGGTGNCVRYAVNNILHRPAIIRLDPRFDCKPEYY